VIFSEIAKAEAIQVVAVRGIAEGAEVGVVRGFEAHGSSGANQAVKLLHGANHIVNVLDHVDGCKAIEGTIGERIGKAVEVGNHVGAAGGIPVEPNGSWLLVNPA